MHQKQFFLAKNTKIHPSQTPSPLGRFAPSQITFGDMLLSEIWKYRSFPEALARWLLRWMYLKRHAQSSMLSSCPLIFGGNHILVIFAQNMHQNLFFRLKMQNFPALGGGHPDPPPARSLCSLAVLLGGPLTRICDTPPPPPPKNSSYGPV